MSRKSQRLGLLSLLRAAAGGRTDLALAGFSRRDVDWAITTGLGPWLARSTADDPRRGGSERDAEVQSADLTARVLTGETLDAATEIIDACSSRGLIVGLLKGISTCDQYYPEPHLRPMGDIDLLTGLREVDEVESILVSLGYERTSPYPPEFYANHHHTCPFLRAETEDWVEVHVGLFPPLSAAASGTVFEAANIAAELEPSMFRQRQVHRLSAELQVVYLATHWGVELEVIGALVPMVDLLLLLNQTPDLDWSRILGWLEGSGAAAAHLYLLLFFLDRHDLLDLEPEILSSVRKLQRTLGPLTSRWLLSLLERYAVHGDAFGPLMTQRNFDVVWSTLLRPVHPARNLCRLPWRLVPDRFGGG